MPTYDYECDACKHTFELYQGINAEVEKKCPECKKNKLRRLLGTGAAIVFKGSGFYQTDYRSESYKKSQAADGSGGSAKSEGKSETKSESKSDSKSAKTESTPAKKPKKSSE